MKQPLPSSISSPQDLTALILELHEYSKWFSHNAIKQRVHAKRGTPPTAMSPGALELIRAASGKKLLSQSTLTDLIEALEKFRKSAPHITITLVAPPPNDLKQTLVTWCREHIEANVLVTFQFNATICGGMVIRYGSHIFDWSFRRQVLAERHRFPEVLRHV